MSRGGLWGERGEYIIRNRHQVGRWGGGRGGRGEKWNRGRLGKGMGEKNVGGWGGERGGGGRGRKGEGGGVFRLALVG